jgi:hypothetical protein
MSSGEQREREREKGRRGTYYGADKDDAKVLITSERRLRKPISTPLSINSRKYKYLSTEYRCILQNRVL